MDEELKKKAFRLAFKAVQHEREAVQAAEGGREKQCEKAQNLADQALAELAMLFDLPASAAYRGL